MPYKPQKVGNNEVYYHALYHHIAHWAAYAAMMATLISIGAILCASQIAISGIRMAGAIGATLVALGGAIYFIRGMNTYGAILCEAVPDDYLLRTQTFRHETTVLIGELAACACAVADVALIWVLR